jgi:hypothetical protein
LLTRKLNLTISFEFLIIYILYIMYIMELSFKNLGKVRAILKGRQRKIFKFLKFRRPRFEALFD